MAQEVIAFHRRQPPGRAVTLSAPTRASLFAELSERLRNRQGFALATLNLDHVVKLGRDPAFRDAYAAQSHVVADGNPVVWLHRLAGHRVDLLPGSELILPLATLAAAQDVGVALLGSTPAALQAAARALETACPGLRVVAQVAPSYGFDPQGPEALQALEAVAASGAGLCFLALGAPKQEILAARGHRLLSGTGFVSIGAGLDFLAGRQRRAPAWVRRMALEWLWRMALDPRRLARRYLDCALVLPGLARAALRARRAGDEPPDAGRNG